MVNTKKKKGVDFVMIDWLTQCLSMPEKTQTELSDKANVSPAAVSKWLKTGHISSENLPHLVTYFNKRLPDKFYPKEETSSYHQKLSELQNRYQSANQETRKAIDLLLEQEDMTKSIPGVISNSIANLIVEIGKLNPEKIVVTEDEQIKGINQLNRDKADND